jgi:lysophospholipase L1-like esterase
LSVFLVIFTILVLLVSAGEAFARLRRNRHHSLPKQTNGFYCRGGLPVQPKPEGTIRLAFLGASSVQCVEIGDDQKTWPALVTQGLAQQYPDIRFDLVNASKVGYTLSSMLQVMHEVVVPLQPDVLLIYQWNNNLSGDLRAIAKSQGLMRKPHQEPQYWLYRQSALFAWLHKNVKMLAIRATIPFKKPLSIGNTQLALRFNSGMQAIADVAVSHHMRLILPELRTCCHPELPLKAQWHSLISSRYFMPFLNPQAFNEAMQQYSAANRNIAMHYDAVEVPDNIPLATRTQHFVDNNHFSVKGAQAMAEAIVVALVADKGFQSLIESQGNSAVNLPVAHSR